MCPNNERQLKLFETYIIGRLTEENQTVIFSIVQKMGATIGSPDQVNNDERLETIEEEEQGSPEDKALFESSLGAPSLLLRIRSTPLKLPLSNIDNTHPTTDDYKKHQEWIEEKLHMFETTN